MNTFLSFIPFFSFVNRIIVFRWILLFFNVPSINCVRVYAWTIQYMYHNHSARWHNFRVEFFIRIQIKAMGMFLWISFNLCRQMRKPSKWQFLQIWKRRSPDNRAYSIMLFFHPTWIFELFLLSDTWISLVLSQFACLTLLSLILEIWDEKMYALLGFLHILCFN